MARNSTSEINKLRHELEELGERIMAMTMDATDEVSDTVRDYADDARSSLRDKFGRMKDATNRGRARAQEFAEEHPWQLLATGAAVGFLLAFLIKRDRD